CSAALGNSDPPGRVRGLDRSPSGDREPPMTTPLVLAVPSKGRLQENAQAFFRRAGLVLVQPRGPREYRGTLDGISGVEIAYLSAAEITAQLAQGAAQLGVTGGDLVREMMPETEAAGVVVETIG